MEKDTVNSKHSAPSPTEGSIGGPDSTNHKGKGGLHDLDQSAERAPSDAGKDFQGRRAGKAYGV